MGLLVLAAVGLVVRFVGGGDVPAGEVAYEQSWQERPGRDSVASRAERFARPLAPGETVDLDRAPADELVRLPRIGPALAARIVAYRDRYGPFGSLSALDSVPGVGPTTVAALQPHASFTGKASVVPQLGGARVVRLNTASADELAQLPGIGPTRAQSILEDRRRRGPYQRLEDLTRVRGIGPGTIARLRGRVILP